MRTRTEPASRHSDSRVIAESLRRPEAFETIFDRHFDAVHAYLARRAGPSLADDLASATFVIGFERRDGFDASIADARPWLFGIATNLLRNHQRTERRALGALARLCADAELATIDPPISDPAAVSELLEGLDDDQRDVLLLFAWEGLSYEQIATALGVPVGTVRSRLARARARVRAALDRDPAPSSPDRQEMSE